MTPHLVTQDPTASPTPTPTPVPRVAVDVSILEDPDAVFASQVKKDWCAPASVQMTLAVLGLMDTSDGAQRSIVKRAEEWQTWGDSHNGGWARGHRRSARRARRDRL